MPSFLSLFQCGFYKAKEQRVSSVRTALKLRMILNADIKVVFRNLYGLYNTVVGRGSANNEALLTHNFPVIVIKLIAMTVSFMN